MHHSGLKFPIMCYVKMFHSRLELWKSATQQVKIYYLTKL